MKLKISTQLKCIFFLVFTTGESESSVEKHKDAHTTPS